jgi:hypothetical protein
VQISLRWCGVKVQPNCASFDSRTGPYSLEWERMTLMEISQEDLSRHYASMPDPELLEIDANELTDLARQCYDREMAQRHLSEPIESDNGEPEIEADEQVSPDWLDTAATACSFQVGTGQRYAEDAERACAVLRSNGIPSQVTSEHEGGRPALLNVMVPGALHLKAASVLDRDVFNEELEETWRAHFDELSDTELRALGAEELCAGLLDRAARLKRVYREALARRKA